MPPDDTTSTRPIALVVQRYGADIRGGAEHHAAQLARLITQQLHWPVEVLTTTAADYRRWRSGYPPGLSTEPSERGPLSIRRFEVPQERNPLIFGAYHRFLLTIRRLLGPQSTSSGWRMILERLWYRLQGPHCPDLIAWLEAEQDRYHRVIFITYLYSPTVMGAKALKRPYLLIPTLHDEPAMTFGHTRELLAGASQLIVNSAAEEKLVDRLGVFPCQTVGIHLDDSWWAAPLIVESPRADDGPPYLLYLGRIDPGKNLGLLFEIMTTLHSARPNKDSSKEWGPRLIIAGHNSGTVTLPDAPWLHYAGEVSDDEKRKLLAGAIALVQPSQLESLGLVVLEALALGTPVLLNNRNPVFADYVAQVPIAYGFSDGASFTAALATLATDRSDGPTGLAQRQASRGWVKERFSAKAIAAKLRPILALPGDGAEHF